LIAYDALLSCKEDWKELCLRAMLHGGDNDSTGCIAGSFYGAIYGFNGVNEKNYKVINLLNNLF
jgi:ADP-ribosylarginine hydrolase